MGLHNIGGFIMIHFLKVRILACFLVVGIVSCQTPEVCAVSPSSIVNVISSLPGKVLKMGTNISGNAPFLLKRIVFFSLILLVATSISPESAIANGTLGKNFSLGGAMYKILGLATLFLHIPFVSGLIGSWGMLLVNLLATCFQTVGAQSLARKALIWLPWLFQGLLKFLIVSFCVAPVMDGIENKCGSFLGRILGTFSRSFQQGCAARTV